MIDPYLVLFFLSILSSLATIFYVAYNDNQRTKDWREFLKNIKPVKIINETRSVGLTEHTFDKTIDNKPAAPVGDDDRPQEDLTSFDEMDDKQFDKVISKQLTTEDGTEEN